MSENEEHEIVRFYRTSKYPLMMGRLPDGTKIFGGPYTAAQGITGAAMIMLALFTWGMWASFGLIGNLVTLVVVVLVPVHLAGMIRTKNRNPVMIAAGALGAWSAPSGGKLANASLKFRKPHYVSGLTIVSDHHIDLPKVPQQHLDSHPAAQAPALAPAVIEPVSDRENRAVTAIERLMAQSSSQK
ncbi:hypothetical protein V3C33_20885 (plasmid) [Micrococcaceae bacterium Sec5.7]